MRYLCFLMFYSRQLFLFYKWSVLHFLKCFYLPFSISPKAFFLSDAAASQQLRQRSPMTTQHILTVLKGNIKGKQERCFSVSSSFSAAMKANVDRKQCVKMNLGKEQCAHLEMLKTTWGDTSFAAVETSTTLLFPRLHRMMLRLNQSQNTRQHVSTTPLYGHSWRCHSCPDSAVMHVKALHICAHLSKHVSPSRPPSQTALEI